MIDHVVRTRPSSEPFETHEHLAWKLAELAADPVEVTGEVADMIINRVIDSAAAAAPAYHRAPIRAAREQALARRGKPGGTLLGAPATVRVAPEWAAWANAAAVRELDLNDTFVAAEAAHPADNISAILAVAQHQGRTGRDLLRGIATAYEVQIDLCKGIPLHPHRIDQIAHLGPSAVAGLGTLLGMPPTTTFQAINLALHCTTTTWQARTGEISTWKAFAPAFASKVAIEAVDSAMRGLTGPMPIYEGQKALIAVLLDGPDSSYTVPLPDLGEPKVAILESYIKQHAAEYFSQAYLDLGSRLGARLNSLTNVESITIFCNANTHNFIGNGSGDPQKYDPAASRETLDHSLPFLFAVALEERGWPGEAAYETERVSRPSTVDLWAKIKTVEDPEWQARFEDPDPARKAFGGRVEVVMSNGSTIVEEIVVADAHPNGANPFTRADYITKFRTNLAGLVSENDQDRFLELVTRLPVLDADEVREICLPGIAQADEHVPTTGIL